VTKFVGCQLTGTDASLFEKRLNETHKTQAEMLRVMIHTYFDFEKAGYLDEDGNKIRTLETELQLKEKLRQVEANRLQDKLDFQKELAKLKDLEARERSRDRAARNQPRVNWGGATYVGSGDSFMLGDE